MKTRSPLKIFQPRDWCSLSCGNGIENNLTFKDIALSVKKETRQAFNNLLKVHPNQTWLSSITFCDFRG
jgi:hypothetical protein